MTVIMWFGFCIAVAYWANTKGRSPILWGLLAFFISPLLAAIALALVKNKKLEANMSDLRMGQEQLRDRVAVNEKVTTQQFRQMHQELASHQQQNQQLSSGMNQNAEIPAPRRTANFCANCGAPLEAGAKFCAKCGTRVE